jgi:hypothetical protein
MSVTHHDGSFDSGHNHMRPLLIAVAIFAVTVLISLGFTGLPH